MDDRPTGKPPPTPFGRGRSRRVAFAVTLVALPLAGVLMRDPALVSRAFEPAVPAGLRAPASPTAASVFDGRRPSAVPDYARLDADDVRRALPAPVPAVAGAESTTL